MSSQDITELENFLKTAHPDDPRRKILKSRIISIKNSTWMNNGKANVAAKSTVAATPTMLALQKANGEEEEFKTLIAETPTEHKEKTVNILNQFFNEDISNQNAILLIENHSKCNVIMRIKGEKNYNLAIMANGENSLVLKKGNYQLTSNVCNASFSSKKEIAKNMVVTVKQPVITPLPAYNISSQTGGTSSAPKVNAQK